jgi:hypothetical protein
VDRCGLFSERFNVRVESFRKVLTLWRCRSLKVIVQLGDTVGREPTQAATPDTIRWQNSTFMYPFDHFIHTGRIDTAINFNLP